MLLRWMPGNCYKTRWKFVKIFCCLQYSLFLRVLQFCLLWFSCVVDKTSEENSCLFSILNAVVAVNKDICAVHAVKLCFNKILQFLIWGASWHREQSSSHTVDVITFCVFCLLLLKSVWLSITLHWLQSENTYLWKKIVCWVRHKTVLAQSSYWW